MSHRHWTHSEILKVDEELLGCEPGAITAQLADNIFTAIDRWCRETPDATALVTDRGAVSYADLRQLIEQQREFLSAHDVGAGDRVVLLAENDYVIVATFLALASRNAVAVIVNPRLTTSEVHAICDNAQPVMLIADNRADHAAHHLGEPTGITAGLLSFSYQQVNSAAIDVPEGVVAMIYTTGTTGTPKGVMLTHRNLGFVSFVSGALRGIRAGDLIYCVLPMSHVFGLSAVCCSVLMRGGAVRLLPRFEAKVVLAHLESEPVAGFLGVPTMYTLLLEQIGDRQVVSPTLRFAFSGGAPLDPDLKERVEKAFGMPLHNGFGLTETGPTICQTRLYAPLASCAVGFVLPGVEVELRNLSGNGPAENETGVLWVKGPNVMAGYFRQSDMTAQVLKNGWFCTGDLAQFGDDGALCIVGRHKELIIRSGFNVYPPEVEAVLNAHPQVALSAVLGRPVPGNEEVVAFVQLAATASMSDESLNETLRTYCREKLAPYKVPGEIRILAELPTASSGKVLKHKLKEWADL